MASDFTHLTLKIDALSCRRGERILFENFNLEARSGEIIQFKGPNGVGKSSLLRILSGLLKPHSGKITLDAFIDLDIPEFPSLSGFADYLAHNNGLKTALSVYDNLKFWHDFATEPGLDVREALDAVELPHLADLPVGVLSAGQKRRVAFARLLVSKRPIWLLDEPTAALDRDADEIVGKLITSHVKARGLVLVATHLPLRLSLKRESVREINLATYAPKQAFHD